jgi:hypothetical protein
VRAMARQIVVLMEGSGNAFDKAPSNVTRVLEMIDLGTLPDGSAEQIAIWDYGVGTRLRKVEDAEAIAQRVRGAGGLEEGLLTVLSPPRRPWWSPFGLLAKLAGLAVGYGLESNIVEAMEELSRHYEPGDRLFLFGFSRGAFTVRVLAALLYRFGMPPRESGPLRRWVAQCLRFKPAPNPEQSVREVWFRGCHSDIGGGREERANAEIALRWMLREAQAAGLALNDQGRRLLEQADPESPITPTERWKGLWRVADFIPRWEIVNDYSPARLRFVWGHTGTRTPVELLRNGYWTVHPSVRARAPVS